jgi:hypothetical protein
MLTGVIKQVRYARFLVNENSTTVLTGLGAAGVVTTAYLTGRASFKAARLIDERISLESEGDEREISNLEKAKLVWHGYIPAVLVGGASIAFILASNRIATKRITALALASGISERAFSEYKERVVEKFGENKARDIRDDVAIHRVAEDDVMNKEVVVTGTGEVLCYDMHTGRYFMSSMEAIKRAENHINYELVHFCSASLSEFYHEIGLPPTSYSDAVGWDVNNHMEVHVTTVMSSDNRPCLAIDFSNPPVPEYNRHRY